MFGTWKYGKGQGQVENLKTSHDYETARSNQHQACNRCHEKKIDLSQKSDPPSAGSSRSSRDGSGSPKSFHKSYSSKSKDRRGTPQPGSSRGDSVVTGGNTHHECSVLAGHGMTAFDGYPIMSSTMEAQSSGYPATAPMGDFAAIGDYTQGTWMLDGSTSTGIGSSFIATSEAMYTDDAHAFSSYSNQTGFDMYQQMYPDEDPRFGLKTRISNDNY
ncbi:hypothetical protein MAC_02768 [Metarhizium acridum CQMa 102]|uniref:Uncharacterized protein n=1 Tax=Metarhizium acridum (strain CQMa 102) TaxID=655827 RepID=E9DYS0_METAQ|nr:uncharacterized protein MAC_02768 [Metarhizium acridum CQMa 102]EFY91097.1 hypothetical protein MAC_02768 [Metarhizium acridum CQMa 102]